MSTRQGDKPHPARTPHRLFIHPHAADQEPFRARPWFTNPRTRRANPVSTGSMSSHSHTNRRSAYGGDLSLREFGIDADGNPRD